MVSPKRFPVNAGALFPARVRYLCYGQRKRELRNAAFTFLPARTRYVYVRVQEGRTTGKVQTRLEASVKGPRPTRFTTLSCNYHHKVDFTSSKSPRKGMLHFAPTRPRAWAPFSTTLGLRHLRGNHLGLSSRPLSVTLHPSANTLHPFHSARPYPSTASATLKPAEGYLLLRPEIAGPPTTSVESVSCSWRLRVRERGSKEERGNLFDLG